MRDTIKQQLRESIKVKEAVSENLIGSIERIVKTIINSHRNKGKIVLFGNGGSASDAQHIAAELVGKFKKEREPVNAVALNTNTSIITAISNDYDFESVFERQIEAITNRDDVVIGITTSGNSTNVIRAIRKAREIGAKTIVLTGITGGKIDGIADITLKVPSNDTARIQEVHITIGHIICHLVEEALFQ